MDTQAKLIEQLKLYRTKAAEPGIDPALAQQFLVHVRHFNPYICYFESLRLCKFAKVTSWETRR